MICVKETENNEENLWERYAITKDINIRNKIIEKYSHLVKIIALKIRGIYQQFGDVDDVINEGIIALIDVIDKFDINKNVKFETYASIRIKGAIIDYVRKQDWTPRKVKSDAKILNQAEKELNMKLGRAPSDIEIAEFLNIDMEEYNHIVTSTIGTSILSFEELIGEANLRDREIKLDYELPEDIYETKELSKILKESINNLNEKEKLVISLYYIEEIKLKDISKILNVSNSRASQIHSIALEKLQKSIKEYLQDKI